MALTSVKMAFSGIGDNEVVPASPGQVICVHFLVLNVALAVTFKWRSGANDISGAMVLGANSERVLGPTDQFVIRTGVGEALVANLSLAVACSGWLIYEYAVS